MPGRRGKRCLRHPACITPAPYGARIPPRPRPRRWKLVLAEALAAGVAALSGLIPAGQLPATAWLTCQYRRRGAPGALGLWAVVADGFAASVTILALLLAGAAAANLGSPVLLTAAAVVLIAGSAGFVAAAHRAAARCRPAR